MYGEWLREQFDKGAIPEPTYDPDLAILLSQLRENSINLFGPEATEVIEPVPMTDIRRAIKESLPGLIASIEGDERNVILTMDELEHQLNPDYFFRANRQYIINVEHVLFLGNYFGGKLIVRLKGYPKTEIQVSKEKVQRLKEWIDR